MLSGDSLDASAGTYRLFYSDFASANSVTDQNLGTHLGTGVSDVPGATTSPHLTPSDPSALAILTELAYSIHFRFSAGSATAFIAKVGISKSSPHRSFLTRMTDAHTEIVSAEEIVALAKAAGVPGLADLTILEKGFDGTQLSVTHESVAKSSPLSARFSARHHVALFPTEGLMERFTLVQISRLFNADEAMPSPIMLLLQEGSIRHRQQAPGDSHHRQHTSPARQPRACRPVWHHLDMSVTCGSPSPRSSRI